MICRQGEGSVSARAGQRKRERGTYVFERSGGEARRGRGRGKPRRSSPAAGEMVSVLRLSPGPRVPHARCGASRRPVCCRRGAGGLRSQGKEAEGGDEGGSRSENAVLKAAWYGSEMLGIAASFLRPSSERLRQREEQPLVGEGELGLPGRERVVEAIKEDFQRSYFVTGTGDRITVNLRWGLARQPLSRSVIFLL